jgi:hypothetical protein
MDNRLYKLLARSAGQKDYAHEVFTMCLSMCGEASSTQYILCTSGYTMAAIVMTRGHHPSHASSVSHLHYIFIRYKALHESRSRNFQTGRSGLSELTEGRAPETHPSPPFIPIMYQLRKDLSEKTDTCMYIRHTYSHLRTLLGSDVGRC